MDIYRLKRHVTSKLIGGADSTPLTHENMPVERIWHVSEF